MKRILSPWLIGLAALLAFAGTFFFQYQKGQEKAYEVYNKGFDPYLSAYTEGVISRRSPIVLRFSSDRAPEGKLRQALEASPFSFQPQIEGEAVWTDARTLAFRPKDWLPSGQRYLVDVDMAALLPDLPDSLHTFRFAVMAKPQHVQVRTEPAASAGPEALEWHRIAGEVSTADYADDKALEAIFKAQYDGEALAIKWQHHAEERRHTFVIDSLRRGAAQQEVVLAWNGKGLGLEMKESRRLPVPAKGNFVQTQVSARQSPSQMVVVEFSDPLRAGQDLEGLVHLGEHAARWVVEGRTVRLFPKSRLVGEVDVVVEPGIENLTGIRTRERQRAKVKFDPVMPQAEVVGQGSILPSTGGKLPFLFKTIALNAVEIRVIKIFEDNVPQFLQVNELDGQQELKRVGQQVLRKRIDLGNLGLDLMQWQVHSIDLSSLIQREPGAIYEIAIGFSKDFSLCDCSESKEDTGKARDMLALSSNWDQYAEYDYSYWDYYSQGYEYSDRDNPCLHAYYNSDRVVRRNILASDLGLIVKRGSNGEMKLVATSLQQAEPLSGVRLQVLDYQQRVMAEAQTDGSGMATVTLDDRPFLLVAKRGEQRGYLRLDDGLTLSLSRFDTQGSSYHKGVKGFVYAERGVWRPGDMMYVNFVLEDHNQAIPDDHPVTFELFNPQGQLVRRTATSERVENFYSFHTATRPDAPTGNYLAKVSVGGAVFQKTMKVETVMPNRLKINFDFGKESLSVLDKGLKGTLDVRWLHGAIAKSLEATVEVSLSQSSTSFPKYTDYTFDDPVRRFEVQQQEIFNGKLDETGHAGIPANFKVKGAAPGMLQASFKAKVFEPGGNFSVDRFSIPYHPYGAYVGMKLPKGDQARGMLLTDTDHPVDIVTLDPDGNPVSAGTLEVNVYKLDWRWWWERSDESFADYRGRIHQSPIQTATVTSANGKASWKLRVNYPDWGRYLVRVCDGTEHCTGQIVYIDWPGWAGRGQKDNPGGASMLIFSAEKTAYQVGEDITLTIPSPEAGKALISIESGSKVLQTHWVDADKGSTRFTFKASPDMAPNIYASVLLLQPHKQTANDLPMRLYGVIPLQVEDPQTKLSPLIAMRDELGPMEDVTIKVSEASGKPMTYTLAVVDEGLLDLTRFKTPSPWHTFYAREALQVKTWDLFDQVIGAYGGSVASLLGIGGDEAGLRADDAKQDRFKPVVVFMGPFTLEKGASKTHTFRMPNYVGSVRTMVVAGNTEGAYGSAEKATPVRKPLMALATLPRVLGPGESFDLPVTVFAMDESISDVKVTVEDDGMLNAAGIKTKTLRFSQTGDQMVTFSMKARSEIGKGTVKVTATSGAHIARYEVDVEVRTPNPRTTNVHASALEPGKSWAQRYTPVGMAGTNEGALEVSSVPPLNLSGRLRYLLQYPYGCIEQTTSSGFPQVYLSRLMRLSPAEKEATERNVRATIDRLRSFQLSEGNFSYWPGQQESSPWGTSYAGHFLLEAQRAGYNVPSAMLNNWKDYEAKQARKWSGKGYGDELMQSYRLYLLALGRSPEMGAMNRMRRQEGLSNAARWNLAAAYHLAGQPEVAKELAAQAGLDVKPYSEMGYTYGSTLRDQAIILQALSMMGDRTKANPLVDIISGALSKQGWMSTQTTAFCLVAMANYVGGAGTSSDMAFSYRINGGEWTKVKSETPLWKTELASVGADEVEFRNDGKGMLYARVVLDGVPQVGDATRAAEGLSLSLRYADMDGNALNPVSMEQGTDFMVEVKVKNTGIRGRYDELVLAQTFPSGWEIHNNRMDMLGQQRGDRPEYQDIRDDRVYTFFDLEQGEEKTFVILLNASYKGQYYMPTVLVEAMYDHGINAREPGAWVNVVAGQ